MKTLILTLSLFLSGCATTPLSDFDRQDAIWLALHAIDVGQTVQTSRNHGCLYEQHPVTRNLIGRHPDTHEVYQWGIGYALARYAFYKYFGEDIKWLKKVENVVRFEVIYQNHRKGVRPWGASYGNC